MHPTPPGPGHDCEAACLGYLELLVDGAPAEAYDAAVSPGGGPGAGQTPAAARGRQLALRIRAELEARRRREAELTALFERCTTWPGSATWTRCSRPSCGGPAGCWAPTWPT
ncbi:hypothetical protein ACH4LN_28295 [Streptomyces albus]|uniref:hypothetical protein n=1 Tax=Streptomyces TaxID=1883 RepID=UPI001F0919AA|nr:MULTISPECIES: hypothetical protein [Streptomyces]